MSKLAAGRREELVELLAALVRIPSVNVDPAESDRTLPEADLAAFVRDALDDLGMTVQSFPMRPGRDNLVGRWDGADPLLPPLSLEAHLDTVGIDEMTVAPFAAEVRDGRMYGRGTCDTKGSLAAFLGALRIARSEGWSFERPVQLVATVAEETGCEGAIALAREEVELGWLVIGEPTSCRPIIAHKGCAWLEVTIAGRAAHGSTPDAGDSAILRAARVLDAIERDWLPSLDRERHPLLGPPTVNVGKIQGGEKVNVVPARCRLELDCRVLPQVTEAEVIDSLRACLDRSLGAEAEKVGIGLVGPMFPGFELAPDAPLAEAMRRAVAAAGGDPTPRGVSYFSDAGPLAAAGFPAIVFGPGDIRQAHGPEEYLELEQLFCATETVLELLSQQRQG